MPETAGPGDRPPDAEVRRRVRGFAYRLTGDADFAEDVAQETLVRALREVPPPDLPWLFRVALNLVRSEARRAAVRRSRTTIPADRVADPRDSDPHRRLESEEERARLWEAMGRAPDRERQALVLRYCEGMSCADVGRVMGMSPNAVSCLLHRGKERVRGLLSPRSVP